MMKHKSLSALAAIILVAGLMVSCGGADEAATATAGKGRKAAPDFSLPDIDGKTHRLSDYRGKVVVVNFWDTWCGPCKHEIPGFIATQNKLGPEGLQLLGVALGKEGDARVKQYAEQSGMNYPVLLLGDNVDLVDHYGGIASIPTTFIIDREGNLADQHVGYLSERDFQAMIMAELGSGKGT